MNVHLFYTQMQNIMIPYSFLKLGDKTTEYFTLWWSVGNCILYICFAIFSGRYYINRTPDPSPMRQVKVAGFPYVKLQLRCD